MGMVFSVNTRDGKDHYGGELKSGAAVVEGPDTGGRFLERPLSGCGRRRAALPVLLLLLLVAAGARADSAVPWGPYMVRWFGVEAGLPEPSATAMAQTGDGFLWFGTFSGLARFDGVRFESLTPRNTPELPSVGIVNLYRDRSDRLWVSTSEGLACLREDRWRRYTREDGWTTTYVRSFAEAPDGTLYVTGFDGKVLRLQGGRFDELPPVLPTDAGAVVSCDPEGVCWVFKVGFLGYWDGQNWQRVPLTEGPGPKWEGAGSARDGKLWVVAGDEIRKVDRTGTVLRVRLDQRI